MAQLVLRGFFLKHQHVDSVAVLFKAQFVHVFMAVGVNDGRVPEGCVCADQRQLQMGKHITVQNLICVSRNSMPCRIASVSKLQVGDLKLCNIKLDTVSSDVIGASAHVLDGVKYPGARLGFES